MDSIHLRASYRRSIQVEVSVSVFTGHCVMMPMPYQTQSQRKTWLLDMFAWLQSVEGDYDLLLVKEGSMLNKEQVLKNETHGWPTDDHIIWFFARREDAMLFHLKWVDNG